ncbi:MAG TPA: hypothetical protein VFV33_21565 [Gemmatimonadaceae bacterium]|nr:hypothetical protein [Gemmatimonadaceae bacterium]
MDDDDVGALLRAARRECRPLDSVDDLPPEGTTWVYRHHLEDLWDALWDADLRGDEGPLVTAARRLVQRFPPGGAR